MNQAIRKILLQVAKFAIDWGINAFVKYADTDKDGKVSIQEFRDLANKLGVKVKDIKSFSSKFMRI